MKLQENFSVKEGQDPVKTGLPVNNNEEPVKQDSEGDPVKSDVPVENEDTVKEGQDPVKK